MAEANTDYTRTAADLAADADYEDALAVLDEQWQINYATAQRNHAVAGATNHRNFVASDYTAAYNAATQLAQTTRDTADAASLQVYTIGESGAKGLRNTVVGGSNHTRTEAISIASVANVTETAEADHGLVVATANAAKAKVVAIATAESAFAVQSVSSLAIAVAQLETTTSSPWSVYEASVLDADSD